MLLISVSTALRGRRHLLEVKISFQHKSEMQASEVPAWIYSLTAVGIWVFICVCIASGVRCYKTQEGFYSELADSVVSGRSKSIVLSSPSLQDHATAQKSQGLNSVPAFFSPLPIITRPTLPREDFPFSGVHSSAKIWCGI